MTTISPATLCKNRVMPGYVERLAGKAVIARRPAAFSTILGLFTLLQAEAQEPTNVSLTSQACPVCALGQRANWQAIHTSLLGAVGQDVTTWVIGSGPVGKWVPFDVVKQPLCGTVQGAHYFYDQSDKDWAFNISPYGNFAAMLQEAKDLGSINVPCGGDCVHAEIKPDVSFLPGAVFPIDYNDPGAVDPQGEVNSSLLGDSLCVYGPWVHDDGHKKGGEIGKPEIHPAQLLWWRDAESGFTGTILGYDRIVHTHLWVLQDNSGRFNSPVLGNAWSRVPLEARFDLPFEVSTTGSSVGTYVILETYANRVVTAGVPSARLDDDDGVDHAIVFDDVPVLRVREAQPDDHVGVRFVGVCRDPVTNKLRGYIELTTVVGNQTTWPFLGGQALDVVGGNVSVPVYVVMNDLARAWHLTDSAIVGLAQELTSRQHIPHLPSYRDFRLVVGHPHRVGPSLVGDITFVPIGDSSDQNDVRQATVKVGGQTLTVSRVLTDSSREEGHPSLVVTNVPLTGGGMISLELDSGPPVRLGMPKAALIPILRSEEATDTAPASQASDAFAAAARIGPASREAGTHVVHARKWTLSMWPQYAPLAEDGPSGEDETPVVDLLNQGIDSSAGAGRFGLQTLFGTIQPFTISWSFRASNVTTGHAVPVRVGGHAGSADVGVTLGGHFLKNEVHVEFPSSAGEVYRLEAMGTVTDVYGIRGTFRHSVWSHYLSARGDSLTSRALAIAARMAGQAPDDLVRAAEDREGMGFDPSNSSAGRRARVTKTWAVEAARDGRVTPDELQQIGRLIAAPEPKP